MTNGVSNPLKRIVILGGGFGGVYVAQHLGRLLRGRGDVEVCIVNDENYFVFQPMLAEVVSGNIGILDTVTPINRIAPQAKLYVRGIEHIDLAAQTVILSPGLAKSAARLKYDHLIVALGNVTDFRKSPGLHAHALPFKNLTDALRLRDRAIRVLGDAAIELDEARRRQMLTFVIGGGGFSGVEVAAELNDFVRRTAEKYFHLDPTEPRVILVHSHDRILDREMPESLALYAQKVMSKRGVEFIFNRHVVSATPEFTLLDDGTRLPSRTLVSTVPSSPNPLVAALGLKLDHGRLVTDGQLLAAGADNVWSLGDCAAVPNGEGGTCPPTAQFAVRQAKTLAQNVVASLEGGPKHTFKFAELGKLAALGRRRAVGQLFGKINIHGFTAWVFWRAVYWAKLPGLDRKLRVAGSWLLEFVLPPDLVQTGVDRRRGLTEEFHEAGGYVFKQGDYGNRCYIIATGRAEIIHHDADGEDHIVAQLRPADCFGASEVLQDTAYPVSVRCAEATKLLVVPKEDFLKFAEALPGLADRFNAINQKMEAVAVEQSGASLPSAMTA